MNIEGAAGKGKDKDNIEGGDASKGKDNIEGVDASKGKDKDDIEGDDADPKGIRAYAKAQSEGKRWRELRETTKGKGKDNFKGKGTDIVQEDDGLPEFPLIPLSERHGAGIEVVKRVRL